MKKIIFVLIAVLLLSFGLVNAVTQQEINKAKNLIDSKIDCESLSDSQLEIIGEYYMEQMHPGEAHELMHKMMGLKEGSGAEEQFHINMAKTMYCDENTGGMMGGGIMGNYPRVYGYGNYGYWNIMWILLPITVIFLIAWFVYKFGIKKESSSETPLSILKKRFARGEITKKQFDDIKNNLEE